jgi:hypothetical protein
MRTIRLTFVLLAAFVTLALLAASASAGPGPSKAPTVRKQIPTPVPASAIVPKTLAMLPGAAYPWVQPHFVRVGGVTLARLPHAVRLSTTTQPPAGSHIG